MAFAVLAWMIWQVNWESPKKRYIKLFVIKMNWWIWLKHIDMIFVNSFSRIYEQNLPAIEEMVAIHHVIEKLISQYSKVFEHDLRKYYTDIYVERNRERIAKMINAVKKNLEKGIGEGVYRCDINIEIVSDYKMSYFIFMAEQDKFEKTYSHMEYFNEIFNLHMYGILSEIGLKAYSYIKNKKTIE